MTDAAPRTHLRYGIIGAGMLGLTLAHRLRKMGHDATVIEASDSIGGQTSTWKLGDLTWDRHYHVIALQDTNLLTLLDELNLTSELVWSKTQTGFYALNRLHSMSTIFDFLRFPVISLFDKFRLGLTILRASTIRNIQPYESETSIDWLYRWSGKSTTEKLWNPLLQSKFGEQYRSLSAAFIISTIQRMYGARKGDSKQEMFGYVRGGYATILDALRRHLESMHVSIRLASPVKSVQSHGSEVKVEIVNGDIHTFDRVIVTAAAPIVPRLCPQLSPAEQRRFSGVPYLGIVCASLLLEHKLSDYYITNIVDRTIPFTGVIEMSALVDRREFNQRSLIYLPRYVASDDAFLDTPDDVIKEKYIDVLESMYPHFKRSDIREFKISRVKYVMGIPTQSATEQQLLPIRTSCHGIFMLNTGHITDGVLTVNKIIGLVDSAIKSGVLKEQTP